MLSIFRFFTANFILIYLGSAHLYAGESEVLLAVKGIEAISGLSADEDFTKIIPAFYALPKNPDQKSIKDLFENSRVASWSATVAEYISVAQIYFDSLPSAEQDLNRLDFDRYKLALLELQNAINHYVLGIHPGFILPGIKNLRTQFSGQGVKVVVFDVFDLALLDKQRLKYSRAKIHLPKIFGNPLELSHGNTIIDILLEVAPDAEIIPIWSDVKSYPEAMQYIVDQSDIDIVNFSRAFPENAQLKVIEPVFKEAFNQFVQQGILIKALGNTGTDLSGTLNHRRTELELGPVNNIASYDIKLLMDLYKNSDHQDLAIFAANLTIFADDIALTATVPGKFLPIQRRTLAIPAEGVYSPSTETFESGSSFAAPQLSALAALLLEARRKQAPTETLADSRRYVHQELLQNAQLGQHSAEEWGRGLPTGFMAQ